MSTQRIHELQNETICAMHDSLTDKVRDIASLIDTVIKYCNANERPKLILGDAIAENISVHADTSTQKELLALILKKIKG